jgi:hypothetical protein
LATVAVAVAPDEDVTALTPVFALSPGAAIVSPRNAVNFTKSQTFRVQAEDTSIPPRPWTVRVINLASEASIVAVYLKDAGGYLMQADFRMDSEKRQIFITLEKGTDFNALIPEIVVSKGAKLITEIEAAPEEEGEEGEEDAGEAALDFTLPQTFVVEAQDGSRQTWTVAIENVT